MENKIKKKINIFGKVGKIIITIIIVFYLVGEGFMLAGTIIAAVVPKDSVSADLEIRAKADIDKDFFSLKDGKMSLNVGGTRVLLGDIPEGQLPAVADTDSDWHLEARSDTYHYDMSTVMYFLILTMVKTAAYVVALYFLRALMKQFMLCDTPFCDGVVKKMRAFAIALIPVVAVCAITDSLVKDIIPTARDGVGFMTIGLVAVTFVITAVFKYGTMLQRQYDETV